MPEAYDGEVLTAPPTQGPQPYTDEVLSAPPKAMAPGDINPQLGVAEGAASLITGAVAAPVAGLSGIGAALAKTLGITDTDPAEVVRKVQEAMTYEPRSNVGKKTAEVIAYPFEKLAEGANVVGEKVTDVTGSPAAGAAVNTAIQSAPMLLGKGAASPKVVSKLDSMEKVAAANRAKIAKLEAPVQDGIEGAHAAGYVITPNKANGGIVSKNVESAAGHELTEKLFSQKNAAVTNDLARKDLGLPDDVPITRADLAKVREEAGQKYEAVKQAGAIDNDTAYFQALDDMADPIKKSANNYSHRADNPVLATIDGLRTKTVDAAAAVEEVKRLRRDADVAFKNKDGVTGNSYRELAQIVDDSLDRALKAKGRALNKPELVEAVKEYREARSQIAKSYLADKALNDATGNIDANVYAAALKRKEPLEGAGLQIAKFATQFKELARPADRLPPAGIRFTDMLMAGISKEWLLAGARPIARHILASSPVQAVITTRKGQGSTAAGALKTAAEAQAQPAVVGTEMGAEQRRRKKRANELKQRLLEGGQ